MSFEHDEVFVTSYNTVGLRGYLNAGRVVVPTFEIYRNPTINIGDIAARRFSLIDRYRGKGV